MRKVLIFLTLCLLLIPSLVLAKEDKVVNLYLFYGEGCPHCKKEKEFLAEYLEDKDNIKLYTYEVWYDEDNSKLLDKVCDALEVELQGTPYLVIGNNVVQGFSEGYTESKIEEYVNYYLENDYTDTAGKILKIDSNTGNGSSGKLEDTKWNVPLLGEIDAKSVSLPILSVVIGLVDGFNPCAMWILLFLISMLIGTKDRKKMWILGFAFLGTSGLIYFLFMLSWLNLAMFMNKITIIKFIVAAVSISVGVVNLIRYFKTRKEDVGCDVTNTKMRKKIVKRIKESVENKKFILSILGIMALAALVNIIELFCSLGLPVMYTEILSLNDLSTASYIIYMLIYILFFMLDDIIVFVIAMKTLKISAISNKYSKYSHLVGGIIMILIGILMVFKPEWLMFNF